MIHISLSNIYFRCPYCNILHDDENDIYLNRCNKNKNGYTTIKCECENKFGMTYNMMGNAVSFKLVKE